MSREEVLNKIIAMTAMTFHKDASELNENTRFTEDLDSKSIQLLNIISNIENDDDLGVMLSLSEAGSCKTIGELTDKVMEQM